MAVHFFNFSARWRWVVIATLRPIYPSERDPLSIVQEGVTTPESVRTDANNLAATRIRSPDRPARMRSLCGLSHG
jgi:hypothetical protein